MVVAGAIIVGAVIVAAPLLLIARNLAALGDQLRYLFDLWQEHDTRWRKS